MSDTKKECTYNFIKQLFNKDTGLVFSKIESTNSLLYENALAAITFIHENEFHYAEHLFKKYQRYYKNNKNTFNGCPNLWNVETGVPVPGSIHWEGGNALLLVALNYYKQISVSDNEFHEFRMGLVDWLVQRSNSCELIVADNIAVMYLALYPFKKYTAVLQGLEKLQESFFSEGQVSSRDYEHILNHIILGLFAFSDTSGIKYLHNFVRTEKFEIDNSSKIKGLAAFSEDNSISVEMSAKYLLLEKIFDSSIIHLNFDLYTELEKSAISLNKNSPIIGLPKFLTKQNNCTTSLLPALAPTCYWLFYHWNFNPYIIN